MKEHKLAAIVFTDIVGYTSHMEKDEQHTMDLLIRQREIIFPLVKEYNGEVIKEIGDGLLIMFNSAVKAVRFANAVQNRLYDEELTIRAGIHIGDVIFEEGDVYGSAVNIAARIEPLANPGGICISENVYSQVRNKDDIHTATIGKKHLKGVDGPIEIYKVITEEEIDESKKAVSFIKDLWRRRVFQITLIYLIIAWLIKWAMSTIVTNYFLSPYLVDLSWIVLFSLIPSVILVSYFHGRKGVSKWKKVELIGMPLNIFISVLIIIFVFRGKDLGATRTSVTMENEEGEMVERVVIKSEFRKKIAVFNFTNISGDNSLNYLQYSIPKMTEYDLSQDLFITAVSAAQFFDRLKDAGYPDGIGLPLNLMKKMAEQRHMNFFLTGDLNYINDEYIVNCKIYETKYTRLKAEFSISKNNIFELIDDLSIRIKEELDMPASHIKETVDLPVSEIFTGSMNALKYFSMASERATSNDFNKAIKYLNKAIGEDPDFAIAYLTLTLYCFNVSQYGNAAKAIGSAMNNLYKLPERQQFIVKYLYYLIRQEPEKVLAVANMWVELFPDDLQGRSVLAMRLTIKNMIDEAIAQYKEILRTDPEQYAVLNNIGDLYLQTGAFDSSLKYYKKYAELFPQQHQSYTNLGNFYKEKGDIQLASENYNRALLLSPMNAKTEILLELANIELLTGKFETALQQYNEALSYCRNAQDSAQVYGSLKSYYQMKGQNDLALDFYKKRISSMKRFIPPKNLMVFQAFNIDIYFKAGENEQGFLILEELERKFEPPLDKVVPFGYMFAYAELGEADKSQEAMAGAEDLIKGFGEEMLLLNIYFAQGRINEIKMQYEKAIEHFNRYLESRPTEYLLHKHIARCYRKLKDYDKAEKHIEISLEHNPFNPATNYEAALLYFEMGNNDKALEYLERANNIWKDADDDYELANEARDKYEELSSAI